MQLTSSCFCHGGVLTLRGRRCDSRFCARTASCSTDTRRSQLKQIHNICENTQFWILISNNLIIIEASQQTYSCFFTTKAVLGLGLSCCDCDGRPVNDGGTDLKDRSQCIYSSMGICKWPNWLTFIICRHESANDNFFKFNNTSTRILKQN